MLLALDVGNTQITGCLFDEERLVLQFRRTTSVGNSSDEIGIFLRTVIRENAFHWQKIDRIGICSVVPSINYSLSSAIKKYFPFHSGRNQNWSQTQICKPKRNRR